MAASLSNAYVDVKASAEMPAATGGHERNIARCILRVLRQVPTDVQQSPEQDHDKPD